MSHVFISYVREDAEAVQRLCEVLRVYNIEVWLDREQLKPGYRWADAIQEAIREGAFYISCFSKAYNERLRTYMNEELTVAIEELRQRPTDQSWFMPVLLDDCEVPNRRIGAGETLRSLQWVSLYSNWNDGIRRILSVIQPNSSRVYELIQALKSKSARSRIKAADDLGRIGGLAEMAVPKLVQALDDENETVRAAAADALGNIGVANKQAIAKILSLFESTASRYDGVHGAGALAKLGKPGILALAKATHFAGKDADAPIATLTLARIGQPVIAPLLEAMDAHLIDAHNVGGVFEYIHDPAATTELIEALQHRNADIRAASARALGLIWMSSRDTHVDSAMTSVVSALIESLNDKVQTVRQSAIAALGCLGEQARDAVPALMKLAADEPFWLPDIIRVVMKIGPAAEGVIPLLLRALEDEDDYVRWIAIETLGGMGEQAKDAVPALMKLVNQNKLTEVDSIYDSVKKDMLKMVRTEAVSLLKRLGVE